VGARPSVGRSMPGSAVTAGLLDGADSARWAGLRRVSGWVAPPVGPALVRLSGNRGPLAPTPAEDRMMAMCIGLLGRAGRRVRPRCR
jgi:hypothetical protein